MQPAVKPLSCAMRVIAAGHPAADGAVWPDRDHAPHAGQFFTLRAWGADEAPFLSRPISVHKLGRRTPSTIEFLYQVVGEGTQKICAAQDRSDTFQLTGPMGNGFDVPDMA